MGFPESKEVLENIGTDILFWQIPEREKERERQQANVWEKSVRVGCIDSGACIAGGVDGQKPCRGDSRVQTARCLCSVTCFMYHEVVGSIYNFFYLTKWVEN